MKNIILLISIFIFCSCSSVKVFSDFDHSIDFSNYETFAYFKPEIDKVDISDLDKRRILKSLDNHDISFLSLHLDIQVVHLQKINLLL